MHPSLSAFKGIVGSPTKERPQKSFLFEASSFSVLFSPLEASLAAVAKLGGLMKSWNIVLIPRLQPNEATASLLSSALDSKSLRPVSLARRLI